MYKIVIADDNPLIRMGIKNMIQWEVHHAHLVGEAKNGEEALDILKSEKVDLLITDIRMPGKDGLYLLEKIKKDFVSTETIVISAYDEFQYVKQALQAGSTNYILKPINPTELNESIHNALEKRKTDAAIPLELGNNKVEKLLFVLKTNKILKEDEIRAVLPQSEEIEVFLQQEKNITKYVILTVNKMSNKVRLEQYFENNLEQKLYGSIVIKEDIEGKKAIEEATIKAADQMIRNAFEKYKDSKEFLKKQEEVDRFLNKNQMEDELKLLFVSGNQGKIKDLFENMFLCSILHANGSCQIFSKPVIRFVKTMLQLEENSFQVIQEILEHLTNQTEELYYLCVEQIKEEIEQMIDMLCESFQRIEGNKSDLVAKVKQMIHKNYNQDISLATIAGLFYVSQPYLSKVFKQETGVNLNNYVTEVRIKKARYLLEETDQKVCDIANMVGYEDANYFAKVYKKYVGVSPSDYRR